MLDLYVTAYNLVGAIIIILLRSELDMYLHVTRFPMYLPNDNPHKSTRNESVTTDMLHESFELTLLKVMGVGKNENNKNYIYIYFLIVLYKKSIMKFP